jgi:uncharacterized protein with HEPN domain
MKDKLGDRQRLLHIYEAIIEVETYVSGSSVESFLANSMMKYACVKQIEIIGEAANLITYETKDIMPEVPWKQIVGMRHLLVHEYFGVDFELIWQVISFNLPLLKKQVEIHLKSTE